jgi:hypothetical protein
MINLYKAMGGGWVDAADKAASAPSAAVYPCMEEIEKYCRDVKPGAGRLLECLGGHEKDLTPVCRNKVGEARARLEEAKRLCEPDILKFCAGVEAGQGRLLKCLKGQQDKLAPACREKVQQYAGLAPVPAGQEKPGVK